jgi:ubiquinone/menaquinone biosynthesis C-methylase UbiE
MRVATLRPPVPSRVQSGPQSSTGSVAAKSGAVSTSPYLSGREHSDAAEAVAIPTYLERIYWWAYVHPQAVRFFERRWLINLILLGNYSRLRDAALDEIGQSAAGRTLQVACVYGDLTLRLSERMAKDGSLDVIDVLPIQLRNLRRKLPPDARASLFQRDSTALGFADASYDLALVFFLLHEQPDDVRRGTLAEVFRTVKPGGKIVLIDYHKPAPWHPLRTLVRAVLSRLEPYALDLWQHELTHYLPDGVQLTKARKETYFGGLYQKVILIR